MSERDVSLRAAIDAVAAGCPRQPGEEEWAYQQRLAAAVAGDLPEDAVVVEAVQEALRKRTHARAVETLTPSLRQLHALQMAAAAEQGSGTYASVVAVDFGEHHGWKQQIQVRLCPNYAGEGAAVEVVVSGAGGASLIVPARGLADVDAVEARLRGLANRLRDVIAVCQEGAEPRTPAACSHGGAWASRNSDPVACTDCGAEIPLWVLQANERARASGARYGWSRALAAVARHLRCAVQTWPADTRFGRAISEELPEIEKLVAEA